MYNVALFLHLVGVVLLVVSLSYTLGGLFRAQRATTIGGIRDALGFVPIAERLIPVAMLVILGFGLYMVGDGNWGWGTGWVDVAIALFVLMAGLGTGVEGKRIGALREKVEALGDGPITPEIETLRRDPVLTHVAAFGAWQVVAFLYLMTQKPSLGGAILTVVIAGAVSVPMARAALSRRPEGSALPAAQTASPASRL